MYAADRPTDANDHLTTARARRAPRARGRTPRISSASARERAGGGRSTDGCMGAAEKRDVRARARVCFGLGARSAIESSINHSEIRCERLRIRLGRAIDCLYRWLYLMCEGARGQVRPHSERVFMMGRARRGAARVPAFFRRDEAPAIDSGARARARAQPRAGGRGVAGFDWRVRRRRDANQFRFYLSPFGVNSPSTVGGCNQNTNSWHKRAGVVCRVCVVLCACDAF